MMVSYFNLSGECCHEQIHQYTFFCNLPTSIESTKPNGGKGAGVRSVFMEQQMTQNCFEFYIGLPMENRSSSMHHKGQVGRLQTPQKPASYHPRNDSFSIVLFFEGRPDKSINIISIAYGYDITKMIRASWGRQNEESSVRGEQILYGTCPPEEW